MIKILSHEKFIVGILDGPFEQHFIFNEYTNLERQKYSWMQAFNIALRYASQ